ncbi:unnamed protein product, partial [Durusdinium trenchii]
EQLREAEYRLACSNLSHDYKEAVGYNLRRNKVLHLRDQLETGLQVVDRFMEKRALMICGASKASSLAALQRRIISDASSKFDSVELGKMHHIGILDFTKFGRLSMVEINQDKEETAQWVAAPGTFKNVIEACLTKISTMKYQTCIVHNFACYDGVLEKVVLDLMLDLSDLAYMAFYSECTNPTVFEFAVTTVKDKLLEVDLAKEGATATTAAKSSLHVECDPPPSLTKEEFEKKYPDIGATITLSVSGQNILCQYVDGKVFLSSATKTRAKDYLEKNENKAIEFRLESGDAPVMMEEQTSSGNVDSSPTTLFDLLVSLEKRGGA